MTMLKVFDGNAPQQSPQIVGEYDGIATRLHAVGVRFERWQASQPLTSDAGQDEVIGAYRESIDRLNAEYGFQSVDVISLKPDHPDRQALRQKFLDEHTHSDFEVRYFVAGKGLFYLHVGDEVFGVMCEQGDLISVPPDTKHWFDMGEAPDFKCIRLFSTPEGWVANYTGDAIARSYPRFEQF